MASEHLAYLAMYASYVFDSITIIMKLIEVRVYTKFIDHGFTRSNNSEYLSLIKLLVPMSSRNFLRTKLLMSNWFISYIYWFLWGTEYWAKWCVLPVYERRSEFWRNQQKICFKAALRFDILVQKSAGSQLLTTDEIWPGRILKAWLVNLNWQKIEPFLNNWLASCLREEMSI